MTHRTLNPKTAFYGDGRESARWDSPSRARERAANLKLDRAEAVYLAAFGKPFSEHLYAGLASDLYRKLKDAGYKYSSQYGWRKR